MPVAAADRVLPAPPGPEDAVARLRRLQAAGEHARVLAGAEVLLADDPDNRDLLLIAATSLRHLRRVDDALAVLDRLAALQPRFSRQHQERGLCHVARKDAPAAIDALLRAVNINPALPASWSMLEGLYRMTGDARSAATAAEHVASLKRMPAEVLTAIGLFSDGDLDPAERMVRGFLLREGDHPEAMRLLAKIGVARDVLDDAEILLEAALAIAPDFRAARHDYAHTLTQRHKYAQARVQVDQLLALEPDNADYRSLAATTAVGLITTPQEAEALLQAGDADLVALARAFLYKPRWAWEAAAALGATVQASPQYWRCLPREAQAVFGAVRIGAR